MKTLEQQLLNQKQEQMPPDEKKLDLIPPQYKGMPSEVVEELWNEPAFIDPEKNQAETLRRQRAIEQIKAGELAREDNKENYLNDRYSKLTSEKQAQFPDAQKESVQALSGHIKGQKDIEKLLPEESLVMSKLAESYAEFKKTNPDQPFSPKFSKEIDSKVYKNLVQRLSFSNLDKMQISAEQDKANEIRKKLGIPEQKNETLSNSTKKQETVANKGAEKNHSTIENKIPNIEKKKRLSGWDAGYELAKVAEIQNVDLDKLSREEYAQFAIDNSLEIDDNQLRMSPWERKFTDAQDLSREVKKKRNEIRGSELDNAFAKFKNEMMGKANKQNRYISDQIKVRQGTRDSNSWIFFGINKSTDVGTAETHKSYISVKDLKSLTPDRFVSFMEVLKKSNYNGDVKIFQDIAEQGPVLNDQVVMHGRTEEDSKLALKVAENFFGDELDQKSFGKDEIVDGKNRSYSEILAEKIKREIAMKTHQ